MCPTLGFRHAFWQFHLKAPEDWRSPKPGGSAYGLDPREASWSAVVLYRFSDLWRAPTAVVSAVFFASPSQSARGLARSKTWRPRLRPRFSRSVLDCGSPSAFAARRRLPLFPHRPIAAPNFFQTFLASFAGRFRLEKCKHDLAKKINRQFYENKPPPSPARVRVWSTAFRRPGPRQRGITNSWSPALSGFKIRFAEPACSLVLRGAPRPRLGRNARLLGI